MVIGERKIHYKDGKFYVNGKQTQVWIVGGIGSLYKEGNKEIITGEALRAIVRMWIDRAHQ